LRELIVAVVLPRVGRGQLLLRCGQFGLPAQKIRFVLQTDVESARC
jgi:hypothetical protein